jgi:UrcA family protein
VLYGDSSTLVPYHDLDMSSAEDVKVLAGRLKTAASSVCGREDLKELKRVLDGRECRDAAFANAMAQLQALTRGNRVGVAEAELAQ